MAHSSASPVPSKGSRIFESHTETADEYGRLERCFRDYRDNPFRLTDVLSQIHGSRRETGPGGLLAQPGLPAVSLPRPEITFDSMGIKDDDGQILHHLELPHASSSDVPPLWPERAALKKLQLSTDELDLGPNTAMDLPDLLAEVQAKQHCHVVSQWLPLAPAKPEMDHALSFPPHCGRLRCLLLRELQGEGVWATGQAKLLEQEAQEPVCMSSDTASLGPMGSITRPSAGLVEPVTPPLSPVSSDDDDSLFIPDSKITFIDLTSEPSSPVNSRLELLQQKVQDGTLDSDPLPPLSTAASSPSPGDLLRPDFTAQKPHDLRVEVPVVSTSSDTTRNEDIFASSTPLPQVATIEPETCGDASDSQFEDALQFTIEDRHFRTTQLAGQEWLDPTDSLSRVSVPLLDFDIPRPEWTTLPACPRTRFRCLIASSVSCCTNPHTTRDARSDSALKWTPVPPRKGNFSVYDEPPWLDTDGRRLLSVGSFPTLSSASYISNKPRMTVLDLAEDGELESMENETFPSETTEGEVAPPLENGGDILKLADLSLRGNIRRSGRRQTDESASVLPRLDDIGATSKLLSGFMELRAAKRRRLSNPAVSLPRSASLTFTAVQDQGSVSTPRQGQADIPRMDPATAPKADIPNEKGCFIVSVGIGRGILRKLEESWPQDHLVDRDFSRHNTLAWSPGTARSKEVVSTLAYEADLCLTPALGIIVTTLLKVKQKPLPGSYTLTPLRERAQKVSQRYGSIIILVSESNPTGEFKGSPSPADLDAYGDFVRFTSALDASVVVYFVSGAEDTLSKWIIALMCRYSPEALAGKRFMSPEESTWEIFLRRAGINIVAAKVLSRTLYEEFGAQGLALFLTMSAQERTARYGGLCGNRSLLRVSAVMGLQWG